MNNIASTIYSSFNYTWRKYEENSKFLTPLQRKVSLAVASAFIGLASLYFIYRRFKHSEHLNKLPVIAPNDCTEQKGNDLPQSSSIIRLPIEEPFQASCIKEPLKSEVSTDGVLQSQETATPLHIKVGDDEGKLFSETAADPESEKSTPTCQEELPILDLEADEQEKVEDEMSPDPVSGEQRSPEEASEKTPPQSQRTSMPVELTDQEGKLSSETATDAESKKSTPTCQEELPILDLEASEQEKVGDEVSLDLSILNLSNHPALHLENLEGSEEELSPPHDEEALLDPVDPFLQDKAELDLIIENYTIAAAFSKKSSFILNMVADLYQLQDMSLQQHRMNCVIYVINHLIQNKQLTSFSLQSLISTIKRTYKPTDLEVEKNISSLVKRLTERQKKLEIIESYNTILFKKHKSNPWKEITCQEAFDTLKQLENGNLDRDELIKNMLVCTINSGKLDRLEVNLLLSKGMQALRTQLTTIPYGSGGNASYIFEKLYGTLQIYRDDFKIKYENSLGTITVHKLFNQLSMNNESLFSIYYNNGHYSNQIYDFSSQTWKIYDNLHSDLRFNDVEGKVESRGAYCLCLPEEMRKKIEGRIQLEELCIPKWEANNCYLSAGWLNFTLFLYTFHCACEAEMKELNEMCMHTD